jgi:hypothetical protein
VESELAFFAQDNDGNVWNLGQYPEEYDDGKLVEAPAWIVPFEGARPGIAMKAAPAVGTPDYAQGLGPAVEWFDRAKVVKMGERTCVPAGCFDDVLVTDEFSKDEPGAHQLKYYARGVGNVRVGWAGNDPTEETLVLVKAVTLDPTALGRVRQEALRLEKSAYRNSKDLYGRTAPAE